MFEKFNPEEWEEIPNVEVVLPAEDRHGVLNSVAVFTDETIKDVKRLICQIPAVWEAIKACNPKIDYIADLTEDQRVGLAEGSLTFLRRKDNNAILATLKREGDRYFKENVDLVEIKATPELLTALDKMNAQIQLADMSKRIDAIQKEVVSISRSLEDDRIALADSCQQSFLQISYINDPEFKKLAVINLIGRAEDCRSKNMRSLERNVDFIYNHPKSLLGKALSRTTQADIDKALNEIRDSLYAINVTSLSEAAAYQLAKEPQSAAVSLEYYSVFLNKTFVDKEGLIERLLQLDTDRGADWNNLISSIFDELKLGSRNKTPEIQAENDNSKGGETE